VRLHPSTSGFDRGAEVYDRARPGYPAALVDRLLDELGIEPGAIVADVAAGTGKLTRPLVERGLRVIAVEPVAGMRDVLAATTPGADVRDGAAEDLPLADASVYAIAVAQAFHWFANDAALAELRRILRPGGRLLLSWHGGREPARAARRLLLDAAAIDRVRAALDVRFDRVERVLTRRCTVFDARVGPIATPG